MRGLRLKRAPGGRAAMPSRGVGAAAPSTQLGVVSGPETSSQGSARGRAVPLAFRFAISGVGGRWLLQPLRPERR